MPNLIYLFSPIFVFLGGWGVEAKGGERLGVDEKKGGKWGLDFRLRTTYPEFLFISSVILTTVKWKI